MVKNPTYKVFVPPIGPPVLPGDFDGDGIPDNEDPDHHLIDSDGDFIPDIYDVDEFKNITTIAYALITIGGVLIALGI